MLHIYLSLFSTFSTVCVNLNLNPDQRAQPLICDSLEVLTMITKYIIYYWNIQDLSESGVYPYTYTHTHTRAHTD